MRGDPPPRKSRPFIYLCHSPLASLISSQLQFPPRSHAPLAPLTSHNNKPKSYTMAPPKAVAKGLRAKKKNFMRQGCLHPKFSNVASEAA